MNLKKIIYFCKVVETGNASQAAKQLFVASTAISMQISALEKELGGELFDRGSRPMELTKLGRFFYPRAQELLYLFNKLDQDTKEFVKVKSRTLNIGFTRSVMFNLLPAAIKKFKETHSNVQITLKEVLSEQQSELLLGEKIDIGITRELSGDHFIAEELEHDLLFVDPLMAAIPTDHYLAGKSFLTLKEFTSLPFITYPDDEQSGFARKVMQMFELNHCQPIIAYRASEIHTALALVSAALGVTLVGKSTIPNNRQDIIFVPVQDIKALSYVYSVRRTVATDVKLAHLPM
ncbi:MAG: LysR family transcriptional regulator [Enterobacterales bacterium endosymbiont of Blomia tropicalis]|uniref:LysR family transcriptional regulator n=1 Tax=Mixta mediterraneensis TaxID=2758443 RepID=UPI0025A8DC84|nr:LysR family transcriptional regulator [Mixta mediterraneensis]MDL4915553.1 LysR family transcriptional regulator [Mixta mediterraneensis]